MQNDADIAVPSLDLGRKCFIIESFIILLMYLIVKLIAPVIAYKFKFVSVFES